VCKGSHLYNGYSASKDDHDSWGMCTISTESQTVMIVMLRVTSGMDPRMISENLGRFGLVGLVPLVRSILWQWTLWCDRYPNFEVLEFRLDK
jgi:hypothetical protein